jgi:predicted RND superfamily exporter protein
MKKFSLLSLFIMALMIAACGPKADPEVVSQVDEFHVKWDSLKTLIVDLQKEAQAQYEVVDAEIPRSSSLDLSKLTAANRVLVEGYIAFFNTHKGEMDLAQANLQSIVDAFIARNAELEELKSKVNAGEIKSADYAAAIAPFQEFYEQNMGRMFYWTPIIQNGKSNYEGTLNALNSMF